MAQRQLARNGDYWHKRVAVDNSSGPVKFNASVEADLNGTIELVEGDKLIRSATVTPGYDLDGNLLSDGWWIYSWNAENRLTAAETDPIAVSAGMQKKKLEFEYDSIGRRIHRTVFTWNQTTGTWDSEDSRRYVYDSWNCIVTLADDGSPIEQFAWGTDIGSAVTGSATGPGQEVGGVGALLMAYITSDGSPAPIFYGYDGNGNVSGCVSGLSSEILATYEYDAFGRTVISTGPLADANPVRHSTKPWDNDLDLVYYGYRHYAPEMGRWLSRDTIGEMGGAFAEEEGPIYGFVSNSAVNGVDRLGREGFFKRLFGGGRKKRRQTPTPPPPQPVTQATLTVTFGFDSSVPAKTNWDDRITRQIQGFQNVMNACCQQFQSGCGVQVNHRMSASRPTPPAAGQFWKPNNFMKTQTGRLGGQGLNVLFTCGRFFENPSALGMSGAGVGVVLVGDAAWPNEKNLYYVVVHEAGHHVNWRQQNPPYLFHQNGEREDWHSTNQAHLMRRTTFRGTSVPGVDGSLCQKLMTLTR